MHMYANSLLNKHKKSYVTGYYPDILFYLVPFCCCSVILCCVVFNNIEIISLRLGWVVCMICNYLQTISCYRWGIILVSFCVLCACLLTSTSRCKKTIQLLKCMVWVVSKSDQFWYRFGYVAKSKQKVQRMMKFCSLMYRTLIYVKLSWFKLARVNSIFWHQSLQVVCIFWVTSRKSASG